MSSLPESDQTNIRGLGVFSQSSGIFLYYAIKNGKTHSLAMATGTSGTKINTYPQQPTLKDKNKKSISIAAVRHFRIAQIDEQYCATFTYHLRNNPVVYTALSNDLINWESQGKASGINESGTLIPTYRYEGQHVMIFGEESLHIAYSKDLTNWNVQEEPILEPRVDHWGMMPLSVANIFTTEQGIVLLYYARGFDHNGKRYALYAALLDRNDPSKVLWLSDAFWEQTQEWEGKSITPLGVIYNNNQLLSYWDNPEEGIFAITHQTFQEIFDNKISVPSIRLERVTNNPIMRPIVEHIWESKAVFNPAALYENGKVHLLYRAIGDHDRSMIGYASSSDGIHIDERLDEPVYIPTEPFEGNIPHIYTGKPIANGAYVSGGGGYGGCEDPRLTKIGDTVYMTYVAYDGMNPPRVALSSIHYTDFINHNWKWEKPVLISSPAEVNKNACLFPEKIDGKYVMLHRVFPNILVDYLDDLNFDGQTRWLEGQYKIRPRRHGWDSRKVGAGAPPIKTDAGWLLIYHAVGDQDPGRYKMGAMLLDLKDPTKILGRTQNPILAPDNYHENEGFKAGVAYPCGAVAMNNQLIVYYGGADTVICAATADMPNFIDRILQHGNAQLSPVPLQSLH